MIEIFNSAQNFSETLAMMLNNFNDLENKLSTLPFPVRKDYMENINKSFVNQLFTSQEREDQFEKVMTLILTIYF